MKSTWISRAGITSPLLFDWAHCDDEDHLGTKSWFHSWPWPPGRSTICGCKKMWGATRRKRHRDNRSFAYIYLWAEGVHCRFHCCALWFPTLLKKKTRFKCFRRTHDGTREREKWTGEKQWEIFPLSSSSEAPLCQPWFEGKEIRERERERDFVVGCSERDVTLLGSLQQCESLLNCRTPNLLFYLLLGNVSFKMTSSWHYDKSEPLSDILDGYRPIEFLRFLSTGRLEICEPSGMSTALISIDCCWTSGGNAVGSINQDELKERSSERKTDCQTRSLDNLKGLFYPLSSLFRSVQQDGQTYQI